MHLPSGHLIFRLLAHDGFHTTTAVSRPVEIPRRAPIVSILSPEPDRPYYAGAPLRLWGAVTEDDGALADPEGCSWRVGDKSVLHGMDGWIAAPPPGEHRCTFVVRGRGGDAEVEVVLRTVDPAETDPNRPREVSKPEARRDPGRRKGGRRSRR